MHGKTSGLFTVETHSNGVLPFFSSSPKYLVVCPEVLQVGVEQTIAVSLFSEQTIPIKVQIEKFDGSVIDETEYVNVSKGAKEFKIRVKILFFFKRSSDRDASSRFPAST